MIGEFFSAEVSGSLQLRKETALRGVEEETMKRGGEGKKELLLLLLFHTRLSPTTADRGGGPSSKKKLSRRQDELTAFHLAKAIPHYNLLLVQEQMGCRSFERGIKEHMLLLEATLRSKFMYFG